MKTSFNYLRLTVLMIAFVVFFASGCTQLEGGARIENVTNAHESFFGLLPAKGDSQTNYVFVIHGMGSTKEDYNDKLLEKLELRGWTRTSRGKYIDTVLPSAYKVRGEGLNCGSNDAPPCTYRSFGGFKVDRYSKTSPIEEKLVVYTYFWNDSLNQLQSQYLNTDLQLETGAWINTSLKKDLIDSGFSDATAYLGDAGKLVRKGIEGTLCNMLKDAAGVVSKNGHSCQLSEIMVSDIEKYKDVQFNFLSYSLGSRMLYDVLSDIPEKGKPQIANSIFAARTKNFFMAANQLPLIGLGRVKVPADDDTMPNIMPKTTTSEYAPPAECVSGFFSMARCMRSPPSTDYKGEMLVDSLEVLPGNLEVIAFHDPADLLGYKASGGIIKSSKTTTFIEVNHRNTPVILWLLAWPSSAHAKELERNDSLELILCGGTADHEGYLKANICR